MLIELGGSVLNKDEYDDLLEDIMTDYDFGFPYAILSDDNYKEHLNASVIQEAADIIISKFLWRSTEEGADYWESVYAGLQRIAEKGR
jgi:hypothetical protein